MLPSFGSREGELLPFGGQRSPGGDMYLLGSVGVQSDTHSLQGFVSTLGTELLLKEGRGSSTGVAS